MDLSDRLFDLLGGAAVGDRFGDGVLTGASSELGLRVSFDVAGRAVHLEIAPNDMAQRAAVRTNRLAVSYRSGDETIVEQSVGLALCRAVAAVVANNEERVLGAIAASARAARETSEGGARVRDVEVVRALEPASSPRTPHYTLTPYVGCLVGCRFCYAQRRVAEVRRLELLPETAWGSFVDVRVNLPNVLAAELTHLPPLPIKFCPIVSDPYQAIEAKRRVTLECLEAIARGPSGFVAMVLTRSRLIERDIDVISAMRGAYVGMSIPTIDDDARKHFEPRGAPIQERLDVLRNFASRGVNTFAVVQPLLPGSMDALADALASAVSSVSIDVLRGVEGAARDFDDPAYAFAKDDSWQRERVLELRAELTRRGIAVWDGELPPDLVAPSIGR